MDKTENLEPRASETRPVPTDDDDHTTRPLPAGPEDDTTLWLVSFDDEDDRELRAPQIAEALVRGEISRDTIVWREGLSDWVPLVTIPSLAVLLPASGATANAPLVVPVAATKPAPEAPTQAETAAAPVLPTDDAAEPERPPPAMKGATKIGLPRVDASKPLPKAPGTPIGRIFLKPGEKTPGPTRLIPKVVEETALSTKAAERTPLPGKTLPKAPDRTPLPGKTLPKAPDRTPLPGRPPPPGTKSQDATKTSATSTPLVAPTTPKTSKVETAKQGPAESPNSARARMSSNPDIWGGPDEDEAPISVEPDSLRPPSPTDSPAIFRAKALSPGILAVKKPKAPPAPKTPLEKPAAKTEARKASSPKEPEERAPDSAGTPSLNTLAALAPTPHPAADDEILRLVGGDLGPEALGAPTIEVPDFMQPSGDSATPLLAAPMDLGALTKEPADDIPVDVSGDEAPGEATLNRASSKKAAQSAAVAKASPAAETKSSKRPMWPLLLGGAAVAAIGLYSLREHPADEPAGEVRSGSAPAAESAPAATETAAAEPAPAASPSATETAQATPAPTASTPTLHVKSAATGGESPTPKATESGGSVPKSETAGAAPAPAKEARNATPQPPQKEVDVDAEFDKAAASAALGAAAQQASSCRKEGDPTGVAVVHVSFSNAGRATRAVVEGPPFAGTATGGCIAEILRKTKVPPYGGDRVTVTKRVVIE